MLLNNRLSLNGRNGRPVLCIDCKTLIHESDHLIHTYTFRFGDAIPGAPEAIRAIVADTPVKSNVYIWSDRHVDQHEALLRHLRTCGFVGLELVPSAHVELCPREGLRELCESRRITHMISGDYETLSAAGPVSGLIFRPTLIDRREAGSLCARYDSIENWAVVPLLLKNRCFESVPNI